MSRDRYVGDSAPAFHLAGQEVRAAAVTSEKAGEMGVVETVRGQVNELLQICDKTQLRAQCDMIEQMVTKQLLEQTVEPDERQALTKLMGEVNDVRVRELGYPEWRHLLHTGSSV